MNAGRPTNEEAAAHAEAAYQLRMQGKSYRAIAREIGFASPNAAYKAVARILQASAAEPPDELRALESERMDAMLERLAEMLPSADNPLFVIDRMLKVQAQRAQLLGLNKPVVVEDDLGDQLAATLKRVTQRYQASGAESAEPDATPQDA